MKSRPSIGNHISLAEFTELIESRAYSLSVPTPQSNPSRTTQRWVNALESLYKGLGAFIQELHSAGLLVECPNAVGYQNALIDKWSALRQHDPCDVGQFDRCYDLAQNFKTMLLGYQNELSTDYLEQLLTVEERYNEYVNIIDQGNIEWYLTPLSDECALTGSYIWVSFERWVPFVNMSQPAQGNPNKVQTPVGWSNPNHQQLNHISPPQLPVSPQPYSTIEARHFVDSLPKAHASMLSQAGWTRVVTPLLDELATYSENRLDNEAWIRARIERRYAFCAEYPEFEGLRSFDLSATDPWTVMRNQLTNSLIASALSVPLTTTNSMSRQCFLARHAPEVFLQENHPISFDQAKDLAEATYPGLFQMVSHVKALIDDDLTQREMLLDWLRTPHSSEVTLDNVDNLVP